MKLQIPAESIRIREQLFGYLLANYDCKIIKDSSDIEVERTLVFSAPFDNYLQQAIKQLSINFFYIDNGYIGNHNYKKPWYYRVSYNQLQNTRIGQFGNSRIHTLELDGRYEDWNADGEYNLLVMPLPNKLFSWFGKDYEAWRAETIQHYLNQDTYCVVRDKPGGRASRQERFRDILPLIRGAKKVITHHSMAAVEALCLGKPIEILGESAVQHWQNQVNFNRQEMLEHIAHSQFSRDEFADGTAWQVTMDYQFYRQP
jgi:hypothetical protein